MELVIDRNPITNPVYQKKIIRKSFHYHPSIDKFVLGGDFNSIDSFVALCADSIRRHFEGQIRRHIGEGHVDSVNIEIEQDPEEDYVSDEAYVVVNATETDSQYATRIKSHEKRLLTKSTAPAKPLTRAQKEALRRKDAAIRVAKATLKKEGIDVDELLKPQIEF